MEFVWGGCSRSATALQETQPKKKLQKMLVRAKNFLQVQRIHKGLSINYLEDVNLREGMISAVQGHPAFTVVILKPADTFESVCSELRSAVCIAHPTGANKQTPWRVADTGWGTSSTRSHNYYWHKYQAGNITESNTMTQSDTVPRRTVHLRSEYRHLEHQAIADFLTCSCFPHI